MRFLVTGGAGFIGSNFVRRLLGPSSLLTPQQVTVLDALTYAGNSRNLDLISSDSRFRFVKGDICNQSLVDELAADIDVIVNFAAESHVDRSILDSKNFILSNVLGTQTLLESARKKDKIIFIQISTDEVYGSIEAGSWDELEPLKPNSPYAASKASSDLLAMAYHRTFDLDVRITRCSNNFGPFQFPEKVIPLFITNLIQGFKLPLYGDGLNRRDWLHVDDHCRAIELVIERGTPGEVYNVGGGEELANRDLALRILREFNLEESEIMYVPDRLGHDRRYSVDWTKAHQQLGYSPTRSISQDLTEVVAWYRDNQEWWLP